MISSGPRAARSSPGFIVTASRGWLSLPAATFSNAQSAVIVIYSSKRCKRWASTFLIKMHLGRRNRTLFEIFISGIISAIIRPVFALEDGLTLEGLLTFYLNF